MTRSAPSDRTRSTFLVLQTAVTSAPNDLAICTANVPDASRAPLIRTFCPGSIRPVVAQSLQGGDPPPSGTAAASSNDRFAGFRARRASRAARTRPRRRPPCRTPRRPVGGPSTSPADSFDPPSQIGSHVRAAWALRNPRPESARSTGPVTPYQSTGLTDDACTRTSTSSSSSDRPVDLAELEHIGTAVPLVDDRSASSLAVIRHSWLLPVAATLVARHLASPPSSIRCKLMA